uniref:Putative glucose dehydrogenase n=1 Tax=Corethrella appendiculata TaxID=1370023 RepID=U5EVL2_9DIPT
MEALLGQCAQQSVGPANQLFGLLIQTLLAAQCGISSPDYWPKDYGPTALEKGLEEYDFIVVGAGSAGSVVANRLSENPNWKVLLLEAGGDPPIESEVPLLYMNTIRTTYDWNYTIERQDGLHKNLFWPRGKMLGGSSSMNGLLYFRGNSRDYDQWEEMGNPTWGWNDVLHYFKKSENNQEEYVVENYSNYHAAGGLLNLSNFHSTGYIKDVLSVAAEELQQLEHDQCTGDHYVGYCNALGIVSQGKRQSTAKAFLVSAKDRPNLHIIKNALVTKIDINKKGVTQGIQFDIGTKKGLKAKTKREVIVSAGAVNTPQLLMLSGIGPKIELEKFNIPVISDLPVGENLQDHMIAPVFIGLHKSRPSEFDVTETMDHLFSYLKYGLGKFSTAGQLEFIGFINTEDPKSKYPDIQFHHVHFQKNHPDFKQLLFATQYTEEAAKQLVELNKKMELLLVLVTLLNPKSVGSIKLKSSNPHEHPKIFTNYFTDKDNYDIRTLTNGIKFVEKMAQTKAFKDHEGEFIRLNIADCKQFKFDSNEYWNCYIRHTFKTCYHPAGTAKMGPSNDKTSVVDSGLKVRGVKGLRVADTSIMPNVISGNTHAPAMMIGEKASDLVKDDWINGNARAEL